MSRGWGAPPQSSSLLGNQASARVVACPDGLTRVAEGPEPR